MEKGSYRMIYRPAPCILKISGPIKGGAGDRVLRTLGLSCYTVILALASEGSLREGDSNSAMRAGWECFNRSRVDVGYCEGKSLPTHCQR